MADIVVDEAYLTTTRTNLEDAGTDLTEICGTMRGMDGLVVGAAPVFDELYEFGEQWSGAAEELAEEASGAAQYLTQVMLTFEQVDFKIAEQFVNEAAEDRH